MAYNKDIPAASDRLKDSQPELLDNFQSLYALLDVDHDVSTFASPAAGNEGKHNQVTLVDEAGAKGATTGNQLILYNNAAQLYLNDSSNNNFKILDGTRATTGYTRLSKGIVMAWGSGSGSGDVTVTPSQYTFSTIYSAQVTTWMQGSSPSNVLVRLKQLNVGNTFVVYCSNLSGTAAAAGFQWVAFGV